MYVFFIEILLDNQNLLPLYAHSFIISELKFSSPK